MNICSGTSVDQSKVVNYNALCLKQTEQNLKTCGGRIGILDHNFALSNVW